MKPSTSHKKAVLIAGATLAALLLIGIGLGQKNSQAAPKSKSMKPKATRSGLYQFAYEENGVTIRPKEGYLTLSADGQWVMDSPNFRKSQSSFRQIWTPPHGTYHIKGNMITFQEIVSRSDYRGGPGRPSPLKSGRFQGRDIHIVSYARGIMSSEIAHNRRYEKQP